MYYRLLVVGIVLFWLWTTGTLLRTEWNPRANRSAEVPIPFLWKLVFLHEESSDLIVYNRQERLGSLHLQPHHPGNSPSGGGDFPRSITAIGGFSLDLPGLPRQNVVVHGLMELDRHDVVQKLELSAVVHEPKQTTPGWTLVLEGRPDTGQWHYSVRQGDAVLREHTGTVSQLLDIPELRSLGFDAAALARMQQQRSVGVKIEAHRDKLRINGDDVDTYVVDLKDPNGFESTIHLNQLGQVLAVKTPTDIELLDSALLP